MLPPSRRCKSADEARLASVARGHRTRPRFRRPARRKPRRKSHTPRSCVHNTREVLAHRFIGGSPQLPKSRSTQLEARKSRFVVFSRNLISPHFSALPRFRSSLTAYRSGKFHREAFPERHGQQIRSNRHPLSRRFQTFKLPAVTCALKPTVFPQTTRWPPALCWRITDHINRY